jgi:N-acetylglucosaminyldiphosphoundecaprenol N-acetyl-beta-D-mannosaminyltransferase
VDAVTQCEVVARLVQAAERGDGLLATYVNAWSLVQVEQDGGFGGLLDTFDICFADGIGVVYTLWLTRLRRIKKVTANEFFAFLFQEAANRGLSVGFVGSKPGVARTVADEMLRRFPNLKIQLCASGWLSSEAEKVLSEELRQVKPQILLVGRGQPLQEKWVQGIRALLPNAVILCVGGLFDYLSGNVRQTPRWIRRIGFEWLHRLVHNPRYWRMYVCGLPLLGFYIIKYYVKRSLGRPMIGTWKQTPG